jgi:monoamine oxidase
MTRTPLFTVVRRALHLAQLSDRGNVPAGDIVALYHARRDPLAAADLARLERVTRTSPEPRAASIPGRLHWSRRGFLATAAGAVAGLSLGGCALPAPSPSRRPGEPVLVVGAGIAGLAAAYRLQQQRVPVRLFEAQERVGGRMYSLRDHFADGQVVELGGELIDTGHGSIRALAAELDIALDDLADETPGLSTSLWHFGGMNRTESEIVHALQPVARRMEADRAALGDDDITYRSRGAALQLDRMSLEQWLDAAGAHGWSRRLLEVAFTAEFGLEPAEQSALGLLDMLEVEPFHIFGESDERFRVHDGNDLITTTLAGRLGDSIERGTELEAVSRTADGRTRLSLRRGSTSFEATATHVILTLPFTMLRRVRMDVPLTPVKRRAIDELGYGTNAKLMIGFSERAWRQRHGSDGSTFADLPYQTTWETSRHQEGGAGVLTNFTGGRHGAALGSGTPDEQATRAVHDLEHVFPGISALRTGMHTARFHWPTNPWVLGSYGCYMPGQWTRFGGSEGEPEGSLHFAGEHTSREAQGFMEGGCESGERAAAAVLHDVGIAVWQAPRSRRSLFAMAAIR